MGGMSQPQPSRRSSRLRLRVRPADTAGEAGSTAVDDEGGGLHWAPTAVLAGAGAALGGWVIVTALVVGAWFTARSGSLTAVFHVATQVWLLANGSSLVIGPLRVTLVPLLVTVVLMVLLGSLAQLAARHALLAEPVALRTLTRTRVLVWRNVAGVCAAAYVAAVTLSATIVGNANQGARALVGSLVVGVIASALGAAQGASLELRDHVPGWVRPIPRAVAAGVATALAGGTVALIVTLALRWRAVMEISHALGDSGPATGALWGVQLAYLPTMILWATSYVLGAGFSLGDGSIVSPASTDLGMIPAIPVLGALPVEGSGSDLTMAWLAVGVVAGIVAGTLIVLGRPRGRFDETTLVGGLAGVIAALIVTGLAAAGVGDLGVGRLTGLGPRLSILALLSTATMGTAGMAAGLIVGLVRRRPAPEPTEASDGADGGVNDDAEPTVAVSESADEPTVAVTDTPATPDTPADTDEDEPTMVVDDSDPTPER